jgi:Transglutaminase-like superfamily
MPRSHHRLLAALLALAAAAGAGEPVPAAAGRNLLRNGDFESGKDSVPEGWTRGWFASDPGAPLLSREAAAARAGQAGAALQARQAQRWESFSQRIDSPPRGATVARLSGWVRVDAAAAGDARASLSLTIPAPDPGAPPLVYRSVEVPGPSEWQQLVVEAPVPPGSRGWSVGCAVLGAARASFDELTLTASEDETDLVGTVLAVARSSYVIEGIKGDCADPWIEFSIPLPLGGQTPLAVRLISDPPGAVTGMHLVPDRENRALHVNTRAVKRGDIVHLTAESVVLLHDDGPGDLVSARVPAARRIPEPLRTHLNGAPGLLPDDPDVLAAARKMNQDDLGALFTDMRAFLEYKLSHSGDGMDHALEEMRTGMSACAYWANITGSLLMACGLPTRLLACTGVEGGLQEHYVLETWTEKLGWTRVDATATPWSDTRNIVLRVIYPDAPRTRDNVPTFLAANPGVFGGPDMNPVTLFWQAGETLGAFPLTRAELAALESAARAGFESLASTPADGARVTFAPGAPAAGGTGRVLDTTAARLGP